MTTAAQERAEAVRADPVDGSKIEIKAAPRLTRQALEEPGIERAGHDCERRLVGYRDPGLLA
jgi:hypothetical protein